MELFTFILSFVSGGISITATYTIYLAFKANKKIAELDIFISEFEKGVEQRTKRWQTDLRVVSDNHRRIREKLEADHYEDLEGVFKKLKVLEAKYDNVFNEIDSDRKINEGEITKLYNNIQQTVNMINQVKQDQKLNQNY